MIHTRRSPLPERLLAGKQYVELGRDIRLGDVLTVETTDTRIELNLNSGSKVGLNQVEEVTFRTRGLNSDWRKSKIITAPRFIEMGDKFKINPAHSPSIWEEITGMLLNDRRLF